MTIKKGRTRKEKKVENNREEGDRQCYEYEGEWG